MNKMNGLALIFTALVSTGVMADDNPQDVKGAQSLNKMECIDDNTQTCINDACLNSDSTDCEDNCQKMAQEKCQEQVNE